jgi:uncharacterized lipoprotein
VNLEKFLRYLLLGGMTALLLSGCGMFRTHTDYDKAVEARPLDVPPDLDTPNTAGELIVPPVGAAAGRSSPATGAVGSPPASSVTVAAQGNGIHIADSVANAWQRVGLALERGKAGIIVNRDEVTHSYAVDVTVAAGPKPGFLKRIIGGKQAVSVNRVSIQVDADGAASNVNASGDPSAVKQVLDVLRERLS